VIAIVAREHGVRSTFDPKRNTPLIDLGTVREMVAYIRDDLRRVPGLERATDEWLRFYADGWMKYHMPGKYVKSNGKRK